MEKICAKERRNGKGTTESDRGCAPWIVVPALGNAFRSVHTGVILVKILFQGNLRRRKLNVIIETGFHGSY